MTEPWVWSNAVYGQNVLRREYRIAIDRDIDLPRVRVGVAVLSTAVAEIVIENERVGLTRSESGDGLFDVHRALAEEGVVLVRVDAVIQERFDEKGFGAIGIDAIAATCGQPTSDQLRLKVTRPVGAGGRSLEAAILDCDFIGETRHDRDGI